MMDLKEIRIKKHLTQEKAAKYLNISLRSYQYYEAKKGDIYKYRLYCQILEDFGNAKYLSDVSNIKIIKDEDLRLYASDTRNFKKRYCFDAIKNYLDNKSDKVLILFGLRRTGKTTLLLQAADYLDYQKCAYIELNYDMDMSSLKMMLDNLHQEGYKYIFIDEITKSFNFISTASFLSDIYLKMGMKIIISGTDSLGFVISQNDELYDRCYFIHTSYIPFNEFSLLMNKDDIDDYIEYGGTLMKENMSYDEYLKKENFIFNDYESTKRYIDTAISRNIVNSIKYDENHFLNLKRLYEDDELVNIINRIVENQNHQFVLKTIEKNYKSHDLGSAHNILIKEGNYLSNSLNMINKDELIIRLKNIIEIKDKKELKNVVLIDTIDIIKAFLKQIDIIIDIPTKNDKIKEYERIVFTQPGMRYSIAKALVYSLNKDEYFGSLKPNERNYIINKILDDVKGKILEEIIILDSYNHYKNSTVFKFEYDEFKEYDMVIVDNETYDISIYEIKHSDKVSFKEQTKYLNDQSGLDALARLGNVASKNVLYRGKSQVIEDINYINIKDFLLHKIDK